jgi:hypothetical protein
MMNRFQTLLGISAQRLMTLKHDEPLSNFAFSLKLRRYSTGDEEKEKVLRAQKVRTDPYRSSRHQTRREPWCIALTAIL